MLEMKVAVGTKNPNKVDAVREVFSDYFEVEVVGVKAASGVADQPMDEDTMITGCINRARNARDSENADFGVGIEAGVRPTNRTLSGYTAVTWCAIIDGDNVLLGSGPQFEWPASFIKGLKGGKELGTIADELSGEKGLNRRGGMISLVTGGKMVRKDLNTAAVRSAIIPLVSKQLYLGD